MTEQEADKFAEFAHAGGNVAGIKEKTKIGLERVGYPTKHGSPPLIW